MSQRNPNNTTSGPRGLYVEVRDNNINQAMRRLKKMVQAEGVLKDLRDRQFYEKPSVKRKKARAAARKRHLKNLANQRD